MNPGNVAVNISCLSASSADFAPTKHSVVSADTLEHPFVLNYIDVLPKAFKKFRYCFKQFEDNLESHFTSETLAEYFVGEPLLIIGELIKEITWKSYIRGEYHLLK